MKPKEILEITSKPFMSSSEIKKILGCSDYMLRKITNAIREETDTSGQPPLNVRWYPTDIALRHMGITRKQIRRNAELEREGLLDE